MFRADDPHAFVGQVVGSGHCVAFVRQAASVPPTAQWRRGIRVRGNDIPTGTAIATFDPVSLRYINDTSGASHAAILLEELAAGLRVLDQWSGRPVGERIIAFRAGRATTRVNDGDEYHVIEAGI